MTTKVTKVDMGQSAMVQSEMGQGDMGQSGMGLGDMESWAGQWRGSRDLLPARSTRELSQRRRAPMAPVRTRDRDGARE